MCWNEKISWITFILGTLLNSGGAILSDTSHKLWYIMFQSIIMVQLGEALIWRDPNGSLGKIGTYISFFGVWLQPIIGFVLMISYKVHPVLRYLMGVLTFFYIIYSIKPIQDLSLNIYKPEVCGIDNSPHISFTAWDNSGIMRILYLITIALLLLSLFPMYPYVSGYLILTFIISFLFYKRTFSSIWCWFAVFSPIVCYFTQSLPVFDSLEKYVQPIN